MESCAVLFGEFSTLIFTFRNNMEKSGISDDREWLALSSLAWLEPLTFLLILSLALTCWWWALGVCWWWALGVWATSLHLPTCLTPGYYS